MTLTRMESIISDDVIIRETEFDIVRHIEVFWKGECIISLTDETPSTVLFPTTTKLDRIKRRSNGPK